MSKQEELNQEQVKQEQDDLLLNPYGYSTYRGS